MNSKAAGIEYTNLSQTNSCATNYSKDRTLRYAIFDTIQNSSFILRGTTETVNTTYVIII